MKLFALFVILALAAFTGPILDQSSVEFWGIIDPQENGTIDIWTTEHVSGVLHYDNKTRLHVVEELPVLEG